MFSRNIFTIKKEVGNNENQNNLLMALCAMLVLSAVAVFAVSAPEETEVSQFKTFLFYYH